VAYPTVIILGGPLFPFGFIAEGTLAIEMGATADDMKLTIHPHPTLSESLIEASEVFFGQRTHDYKPSRK
jgi:dihydrolipoamide dehydrogenase